MKDILFQKLGPFALCVFVILGCDSGGGRTSREDLREAIRNSNKISKDASVLIEAAIAQAYATDGNVDVDKIAREIDQLANVESARPSLTGSGIIVRQRGGYAFNLLVANPADERMFIENDASEAPTPSWPSLNMAGPLSHAIQEFPDGAKAVILAPAYDEFRSSKSAEFVEQVTNTLQRVGFTVTTHLNNDASLSRFRGDYIDDYAIVVIFTHGIAGRSERDKGYDEIMLMTGSEYTVENPPGLSDQEVGQLGGMRTRGGDKFSVSSEWFKVTGGSFRRSYLLAIACESAHLEGRGSLDENFFNLGGGGFSGFKWIMNGRMALAIGQDLMIRIGSGQTLAVASEGTRSDTGLKELQARLRQNNVGGSTSLGDLVNRQRLAEPFYLFDPVSGGGDRLALGQLGGLVKDAVTNRPVVGAEVNVFGANGAVAHAVTDVEGLYRFFVPSGTGYRLTYAKRGYLTVTRNDVTVTSRQSTALETLLHVESTGATTGTASGTVLSALNGRGLSGLTLRFRSGLNTRAGAIAATVQTQASGVYSASALAAGNYTVEVSGTGYQTTYFSAVVVGGRTTSGQDATVSPVLAQGETRIVLTWGATPDDLDSHLTGPDGSGGRFHIYFSNESVTGANLDLDDTSGFGPETVTLTQQRSGVYRYSVHDFSNRSSAASTALSRSGARVSVIRPGLPVQTFNVPPNTPGTLWTVFEINGETLTPVNRMGFEGDPNVVTSVGKMADANAKTTLIPLR